MSPTGTGLDADVQLVAQGKSVARARAVPGVVAASAMRPGRHLPGG